MQVHDDQDIRIYSLFVYISKSIAQYVHRTSLMSLTSPCYGRLHYCSPPLRHTCCQNFQANQSEADDLWLVSQWLELCCLWWRLSFRKNHGPVEGSMHTSVVAADNTERMVPEADVTGCHGVISWRLSLLRHTGGLSWQRPGFPSFQWKDWTSQWC